MRFTPKDEQELLLEKLLPDGEYDFFVQTATQKKSKNGNDMIELKLDVSSPAGRHGIIYDYLTPSMLYKIKHFCDATNLTDLYNEGYLPPDKLENKKGKLTLRIQIDKTGQYGPRNSVVDYIVKKESVGMSLKPIEPFNDDVPF